MEDKSKQSAQKSRSQSALITRYIVKRKGKQGTPLSQPAAASQGLIQMMLSKKITSAGSPLPFKNPLFTLLSMVPETNKQMNKKWLRIEKKIDI